VHSIGTHGFVGIQIT